MCLQCMLATIQYLHSFLLSFLKLGIGSSPNIGSTPLDTAGGFALRYCSQAWTLHPLQDLFEMHLMAPGVKKGSPSKGICGVPIWGQHRG